MGKKREIKSKMCNRIKTAQQIRCAKTVYWDLINSNMNKRDVQTGCANGLYRVCTLHYTTVTLIYEKEIVISHAINRSSPAHVCSRNCDFSYH